MMPVTLFPWIARPEPSAWLPAWKKLSDVRPGIPNHSKSTTTAPATTSHRIRGTRNQAQIA